MKYSAFVCGFAAASIGLFAALPAAAAGHKYVFPEEARASQADRSLQVLVPQAEIASDINEFDASAAGGGLLGALVAVSIEADRAKKAEVYIQPLRAALTGYDADAAALETSKGVIEKAAWLRAKPPGFGKDSSDLGKSGMLDTAATDQTAFFTYTYDASPDFASLRVALKIQVANKAAAAGVEPASRLKTKQLAYVTTITSVLSLPDASKDKAANVARWTADNGKLARQALADGFADTGALAARALEIKEADALVMNGRDKKRVMRNGLAWRRQEETASSALLYNGDLIHTQLARQ